MTKIELIDNAAISAADFQAPVEQPVAARFVVTRTHLLLAGLAVLCLLFIAFITLARSVQVSAIAVKLSSISVANNATEYQPQVANIEVSGLLKLPIGNRILMLPGSETVSLTAKGFEPITQPIVISKERHQQFEIVMTRLPGKLAIELMDDKQQAIDVPAQVLINGEPLAELPGLIEDVAAGQYEFTVDAPLYRPVSKPLLIKGKGETQTLSLTLQPAWAEYAVDSVPQGADISVDGQTLAQTPAKIKLEEGLREIMVEASGYKAHVQELGVVAQQDMTVPVIELTHWH